MGFESSFFIASFLAILCLISAVRLPDITKLQRPEFTSQHPYKKLADSDLIQDLPGLLTGFKSKHYAGYVHLDNSEKRLFYYFVESEGNPGSDPVMLWMNGGPGCSSFDGFMYEHGPFEFSINEQAEGKSSSGNVELRENVHSWSKAANMLYLESPVGVGMSYSEDEHDYFMDDDSTAADAENFLRKWFERYPQFLGNDFFVAGESYAGIYVPMLVQAVVKGNQEGHTPRINIQGYMVGNAVTDITVDGNALPPFAAGKSLISQIQFADVTHSCTGGNYWNSSSGSECDDQLNDVWHQVSKLNIYNVLQECHTGAPEAGSPGMLQGPAPLQEVLKAHGRYWPLHGTVPQLHHRVLNWAHLRHTPPCTDSRAASFWLNQPAVREAIHAAPHDLIGRWTICSDKIWYTRSQPSMIPIHMDLTQKHGLRALIYSGDHDMAVPHTGSEAWTSTLGLPVASAWRPWFVHSQVAGYVVDYDHLSYATIKGAGHMVPQDKAEEALTMLRLFFAGEPLAKP